MAVAIQWISWCAVNVSDDGIGCSSELYECPTAGGMKVVHKWSMSGG